MESNERRDKVTRHEAIQVKEFIILLLLFFYFIKIIYRQVAGCYTSEYSFTRLPYTDFVWFFLFIEKHMKSCNYCSTRIYFTTWPARPTQLLFLS